MPLPASAVIRLFFFFSSLNFTLKLNVLNMRPVVCIRIEGGRGRGKSVVTQLLKIPTRDATTSLDPAGRTRNDLQSLGRNFTTPSTGGAGDILNGRGKTCDGQSSGSATVFRVTWALKANTANASCMTEYVRRSRRSHG